MGQKLIELFFENQLINSSVLSIIQMKRKSNLESSNCKGYKTLVRLMSGQRHKTCPSGRDGDRKPIPIADKTA